MSLGLGLGLAVGLGLWRDKGVLAWVVLGLRLE